MNDKVIISADCVCDLPENLIKEFSIQIIPFYIMMKGVRFQDGVEVDFDSIYEYMEKDDEKISSTPASVEDYKEFFEQFSKEKAVIHICVSKKLSVAYENAYAATKDMENVFVVDSGLVSHGMGLMTLEAAELARKHTAPEDIVKHLHDTKNKISCSFVFQSTQYVANNNRLAPMLSNFLDIFKIKPIIKVKHDEMKVRGICVGSREASVKAYIRHMLKNKKNISEEILFITVLSCSQEFVEFVYNEATRKMKWKHVYVQNVSATNLCNVGLGGVGIMFYTK